MKITDPKDFGRVAVALGGTSAEREVSLNSGGNVLAALRARGVDAEPVDGVPALIEALAANQYDRVFNILHGRGGEDGVVQGACEALGIPYTGSGVLGSALTMNKVQTKRVWQALDLPTPRYAVYRSGGDVTEAIEQVGLPVVVKPAREGSSVGITKVRSVADLPGAIELAVRYDGELVIESLIEGDELTVGVLDDEALPSIRIVPRSGFYDYHAKYVAEDTQYLCPGLEGEDETEACTLALAAFRASGASGWGRVDLMRDAAGRLWLLEVNTTPGMTSHSLVPKAARAVGIGFEDLVWRILETSFVERAG